MFKGFKRPQLFSSFYMGVGQLTFAFDHKQPKLLLEDSLTPSIFSFAISLSSKISRIHLSVVFSAIFYFILLTLLPTTYRMTMGSENLQNIKCIF